MTTPQQPPTRPVTAVAKRPMDEAKAFLQNSGLLEQLKAACAQHMTPIRVARAALTAASKSAKLQQCFLTQAGKLSIAQALLTAAQRGLEVDGRQGHLVPFNCKQPDGSYAMVAQFIPGYQGLIDLAYRHPHVETVWVEAVFEKDTFSMVKGLKPDLVHVPYEGEDDPGPVKAVYACCKMVSAERPVFRCLRTREINKIKAFSRGASDEDSPWQKHTAAMWMKSAIRELCKYIPQSAELRDAINDDDEWESGKTVDIEIQRARSATTVMASEAAEMLGAATSTPPATPAPPPLRVLQQAPPAPTAPVPPASQPETAPKRRGRPPKNPQPATAAPQPAAGQPAAEPDPDGSETVDQPAGDVPQPGDPGEKQIEFDQKLGEIAETFPDMTWQMIVDWLKKQREFSSLVFDEIGDPFGLSNYVCEVTMKKIDSLTAWIAAQFSQPAAAPTPAPAPAAPAPPAPAPKPQPVPLAPRNKHADLEQLVTRTCKRTFAEFKRVVIGCGWLDESSPAMTFSELPVDFVANMTANAASVVNVLTNPEVGVTP